MKKLSLLTFNWKFVAMPLLCCSFLFANNPRAIVTVKNNQAFDRSEVVSLRVNQLKAFLDKGSKQDLRMRHVATNQAVALQWFDTDLDGTDDEVLFFAQVKAKQVAHFELIFDKTSTVPDLQTKAYSRFVPERVDDYAWENDRVAFRTYGPQAQKNFEENKPNATLSSGIDLWLKRTAKPIIDLWYEGNSKTAGYYHIDHGDGYDPYHVGVSRGTGGTGIWENNNLLVSKNFIAYKTIATGPLRTVFELTYAPWSNYGVKEVKRISLDLGSNFSKINVALNASSTVPNYAAGITLHNNKGEISINEKSGWISHSEMIDGLLLCEGIVTAKKYFKKGFANVSDKTDESNLLLVTKPKGNNVVFYAGFAWEKSGQIKNKQDWEEMLQKQALILANPLLINIYVKNNSN